MVEEIADLDLVVTDSEMEALALENNLIKRHQPPYNVRLRDDKNHPYLKLTLAEEYPRLYVVRRPAEDGNAYGGPYIPASLGRKTAGLVRKLFGIRSCKETLERPAPAALPAVPDQALPRALRGRGLLARALPAVVRGRAALPGGAHRGGDAAPARADGARGGGRSATRRRPSLRDQVQALMRLEAPQKITTTELEERDLFAAHVEGERAAVQVFCVRDGKVVAREGFLLDRLTEPELVLGLDAAAVLRRRALRARARCWCRRRSPTAELLEAWLAARRGTLGPDPRAAARREAAPAGAGRRATRAWPSTWSGSTRASSRRRSCARCATCSTSRWSRGASSASTSRTSRARTSWPRWWSSRTACRRRPTTASSGSRACRARPTTSPRCARWWGGATSACSRRARTCPTSC